MKIVANSFFLGKVLLGSFCAVLASYAVTANAQQSPLGGQASPMMRPPAGAISPNVQPPSDFNRSGGTVTSNTTPGAPPQMLPPGTYTLEITVAGKTASHNVTVGRSGDNVTVTLPENEGMLSGTINPKGYLRVESTPGSERLVLTGLMQDSRTNAGNAQITQGTKSLTGSFKLSPAMAVRAKQLQKFEDTGKKSGSGSCGFWCTIKGWFTL